MSESDELLEEMEKLEADLGVAAVQILYRMRSLGLLAGIDKSDDLPLLGLFTYFVEVDRKLDELHAFYHAVSEI